MQRCLLLLYNLVLTITVKTNSKTLVASSHLVCHCNLLSLLKTLSCWKNSNSTVIVVEVINNRTHANHKNNFKNIQTICKIKNNTIIMASEMCIIIILQPINSWWDNTAHSRLVRTTTTTTTITSDDNYSCKVNPIVWPIVHQTVNKIVSIKKTMKVNLMYMKLLITISTIILIMMIVIAI